MLRVECGQVLVASENERGAKGVKSGEDHLNAASDEAEEGREQGEGAVHGPEHIVEESGERDVEGGRDEGDGKTGAKQALVGEEVVGGGGCVGGDDEALDEESGADGGQEEEEVDEAGGSGPGLGRLGHWRGLLGTQWGAGNLGEWYEDAGRGWDIVGFFGGLRAGPEGRSSDRRIPRLLPLCSFAVHVPTRANGGLE